MIMNAKRAIPIKINIALSLDDKLLFVGFDILAILSDLDVSSRYLLRRGKVLYIQVIRFV